MLRAWFLLFICNFTYAGIVSIPTNNSDFNYAPAGDLTFAGNRISVNEAIGLALNNEDLSTLEPYSSDLYDGIAKSSREITTTINEVQFRSSLKSPTEFYRASVTLNNQNYILAASLYNHQTLLRAALLRSIGYKVVTPIFKSKLKVQFNNLEEKKIFLESLSQSTLLAKSRWLVNPSEEQTDELSLTLRGVLLEPADIKAVPVYWPIMDINRQKTRRTFRSLLYLYALTDFPQQINKLSWKTGKIFNNNIILDHAYGSSFTHTTYNDLKWMHNKINFLSEETLKKALSTSKYPQNIQEILLEKLKSRINNFSKLFGTRTNYEVNKNKNGINYKNLKLQKSSYPDYVPIFWEEDPLSPFRFSEIYKLFRSQITNDSASEALEKAVDKFIPMISNGDAYKKIGEQIAKHKKKTGTIPLKMWAGPTIQGGVSANRSIVFGQYLASNAPIQLVDTVGYKVRLGVFSFLSGLSSNITPTASLTGGLSRHWSHVRAMPDLTEATNQEINKLLVPNLLKNLGAILKDQYKCSLTQEAWYQEEIVTQIRTWVVYYNKEATNGKEEAIKLRTELIEQGIEDDQILLSPVDKDLLCEKEIIDKRNQSIDEFIKSFALDETITITDSIDLDGSLGAKLDISGVDKLSANLSIGRNKAILRSFSIRKVSQGIEITIQTQNNLKTTLAQTMKFYIDLISNKTQWEKGKMVSKVYKIKLEDVTDIEKINAISTLREILIRNSHSNLKEYYNPIELTHEARLKLNTFRFFWKKSENLRLNQNVEIIVPNAPTNFEIPEDELDVLSIPTPPRVDLPIEDRTKNLYTSMSLKRKGSNYHNFLDRVLNEWQDWLRIGSSDSDPGNSIKGFSTKWYYMTETDLSVPTSQSMTKIEFSNTGWSASKSTIEWMIKLHESYFKLKNSKIKVDRGQFQQTSFLKSYNFKSTFILYPAALDFLKNKLLLSSESNFRSFIKDMYGHKRWSRKCRRQTRDHYSRETMETCIPRDLRSISKKRNYLLSQDKITYNNQIHNLVESLFIEFTPSKILNLLPTDSFFGNIYIGGFRNNDSIGYLQYTSDTIGTYDSELGTGYFDKFAFNLGLTPYLIKGMTYSPGM